MKRGIFRAGVLPAITMMVLIFTGGCSKENVRETEAFMASQPGQDVIEEKSGKPDHAFQNQLLAQIRRATAKYHNIEVALADGYALGSECVSVPGLGAMGHHFVKNSLVDGEVDPLQPEALLYEPTEEGGFKLIGVEYIVVAAPWDAIHDGPPMLGNKVFDDHRPEGSSGPPFPHYQLHAWIWKDNPLGIYFPFNPEVSCEFEGGGE
jgi:hypothetical protein